MRRILNYNIAVNLSVLLFLIFSAATSWPADSDIRLVRSDKSGLTIELATPAYRIVQRKVAGVVYDEIVIADYSDSKDTGRPSVPLRGTLIGIPKEGTVSIKVIDSAYKSVHIERDILPYSIPMKGHSPRVLDENTYGADAFYPGHLATEGYTGYMRDQHVKQILFYPVQYNPIEREVRIYNRILVEVTFEKPFEGDVKNLRRKGNTPSGAHEKLLKDSLLNYETIPR
ncbi:MAG: C25 family peptidase propeptide domain-containing protein [Nitrospira sp.]|nr:C25 family peptidase propeptide domain-containing protein [Nitrospira sp.]